MCFCNLRTRTYSRGQPRPREIKTSGRRRRLLYSVDVPTASSSHTETNSSTIMRDIWSDVFCDDIPVQIISSMCLKLVYTNGLMFSVWTDLRHTCSAIFIEKDVGSISVKCGTVSKFYKSGSSCMKTSRIKFKTQVSEVHSHQQRNRPCMETRESWMHFTASVADSVKR
jgi:hypothetical protein